VFIQPGLCALVEPTLARALRVFRAKVREGKSGAVMIGSGLLNSLLRICRARAPACAAPIPAGRAYGAFRSPLTIIATTLIALSGIVDSAAGEDANISSRRSSERTSFTDSEIMDGFFKIVFDAELQIGNRVGRIRKFNEPVRIFVVNQGEPKRRTELAAIIDDIRTRVRRLDVAMTEDIQSANVLVMLVRKRDLNGTIRSLYGPSKAKQIQRSLNPECLSGFAKDRQYRIRHAEVILPADASDFIFYDCAYEELLQALGPINDDSSVPWTMFNDEVQMGFFDIYDQYLLNILYDPRIRPGMTKEDVAKLMPEVLPTVREWIANTNSVRAAQAHGGLNADVSVQCNCPAADQGNQIIAE
jgi:hypothetical protein